MNSRDTPYRVKGYKLAILLYAFCNKKYISLKRYPLNFVGMFISRIALFTVLFLGGKAIAPTVLGSSLESIIVGYFVFTISTSTFVNLEGMVNSEAKYGTLEQLYLSPFRFTVVMLNAVIASVMISTAMGLLTLGFALLITGTSLTVDLLTVVVIFVPTLLSAIGVSLFFGGVALIYKRVRSLFNILDLVFIAIVSLAMTDRLWPRVLPVAQGASMLRDAMAGGLRLTEFPFVDYVLLLGAAGLYLLLGYTTFFISQHKARQGGLLDDY
jgi:ABC-2 type transport system permease protein